MPDSEASSRVIATDGASWRTWAILFLTLTLLYALIWVAAIAPDPGTAYTIDIPPQGLHEPVSGITFVGDQWSAPPGTKLSGVGGRLGWPAGSRIRIEVEPETRTTNFAGLDFTESCEIHILDDGTLAVDNWNLVATDSTGCRWRTRWCRIGWKITLALFPDRESYDEGG